LFTWGCGLGRQLWWVLQLGRRSEDRAFALIAAGAVVGTGVHLLFDFGLSIPANSFSLALLCGLACGTPSLQQQVPGGDRN